MRYWRINILQNMDKNQRKGFAEKNFTIILLLYVAFLYGLCVLFREPRITDPKPELFRSYRAAWNGGQLFPFAQNIILNILLYTPVGFLICGILTKEIDDIVAYILKRINLAKDGERVYPFITVFIAMLIGLILSLSIEKMQLNFNRGTYEADDILNNTFGSLLGASWMTMKLYGRTRIFLIWISVLFFAISFVLLCRLFWLCYLM